MPKKNDNRRSRSATRSTSRSSSDSSSSRSSHRSSSGSSDEGKSPRSKKAIWSDDSESDRSPRRDAKNKTTHKGRKEAEKKHKDSDRRREEVKDAEKKPMKKSNEGPRQGSGSGTKRKAGDDDKKRAKRIVKDQVKSAVKDAKRKTSKKDPQPHFSGGGAGEQPGTIKKNFSSYEEKKDSQNSIWWEGFLGGEYYLRLQTWHNNSKTYLSLRKNQNVGANILVDHYWSLVKALEEMRNDVGSMLPAKPDA
ncbi:pre-mRNA-splicing factor CWC22 homolog isoform X1 [Folsomia candida]|uniref:pre-mRNA-splicing factor CWC22 homolog isoform X1 n=1 Tax=Folsomia candida TaxID=158441 RepID=UPI0016054107|nr:pre-mRNA-splicing factor CWC22 homolog isoform X1 [Folsomia candida]